MFAHAPAVPVEHRCAARWQRAQFSPERGDAASFGLPALAAGAARRVVLPGAQTWAAFVA